MAKITPAVKSANIGITLDGIAGEIGLELEGEVRDLAGVLNNDAAYRVRLLEGEQVASSSGDWGYYAKQVANTPSQWFKAWVRWNFAELIYDYYLEADAGDIFSHATPNLAALY